MSVFAISKVRLDGAGDVSEVTWGVVDIKSNSWVSPEVKASAAEVLEAIHKGDHVAALFPGEGGYKPEGQFVAVSDGEAGERLVLEGPEHTPLRISDMDRLGD